VAEVRTDAFAQRLLSLCTLLLFSVASLGCASGEAITAADQAQCRALGFSPKTREYDVCLSQMQRQRTALSTKSEQLRD